MFRFKRVVIGFASIASVTAAMLGFADPAQAGKSIFNCEANNYFLHAAGEAAFYGDTWTYKSTSIQNTSGGRFYLTRNYTHSWEYMRMNPSSGMPIYIHGSKSESCTRGPFAGLLPISSFTDKGSQVVLDEAPKPGDLTDDPAALVNPGSAAG